MKHIIFWEALLVGTKALLPSPRDGCSLSILRRPMRPTERHVPLCTDSAGIASKNCVFSREVPQRRRIPHPGAANKNRSDRCESVVCGKARVVPAPGSVCVRVRPPGRVSAAPSGRSRPKIIPLAWRDSPAKTSAGQRNAGLSGRVRPVLRGAWVAIRLFRIAGIDSETLRQRLQSAPIIGRQPLPHLLGDASMH